jgi:hypothetical protein
MDKLLSFLNNNATIEDPALMTETLRTSPPILQEDESIDAAYKCGRDLFIISTKRIIVIDRKGITGKSTEWKSFPLMYNKAFWVETEGHMLNGSELKVYTDDDDIKQGLAKGQNNSIWTIHELLSTKMLDEKHEEIGDSEIELSGGSSFLSPDQHVTSAPIMASVYQPQPFTFQVQLRKSRFVRWAFHVCCCSYLTLTISQSSCSRKCLAWNAASSAAPSNWTNAVGYSPRWSSCRWSLQRFYLVQRFKCVVLILVVQLLCDVTIVLGNDKSNSETTPTTY